MTTIRYGLALLTCIAGLSAAPAQASGGVSLHVHLWEPVVPSPYVVLPPPVVYETPVVYHHYDWHSWVHHQRHHHGHWHGHGYKMHGPRFHPHRFAHGHSGHPRRW